MALIKIKDKTLAKQTASSDQVVPNGLTNQTDPIELNEGKLTNGKTEPKVIDIEDAVPDAEVDKRNMDKILDKTRWDFIPFYYSWNGNKFNILV